MTDARAAIVTALERAGAVAVIRLADPGRLRSVVDALARGGIRALEVTMTVPNAIHMIAELAPAMPEGLILGAGTVLDPVTVRQAIEAGARFVVSPVFRPELIVECHRHGAAAIPGCFTPTEILQAWDAGADIVKVFPATSLGPAYFRDVRVPLPHVKLMPTGGVTIDNAGEWIRAGAAAVGVGSALVDAASVSAGDYEAITRRAQRLVETVRAARAA